MSWYGSGFYGHRTANGETFRKGTLTTSDRTLPFSAMVRMTNLKNGSFINVQINDKEPFKYHRMIDLVHGAGSGLNIMQADEINVRLEVID